MMIMMIMMMMMMMMLILMLMMMSQDVLVDKISRDLTDDCIVYALLVMFQRSICLYIYYLDTYIYTHRLFTYTYLYIYILVKV